MRIVAALSSVFVLCSVAHAATLGAYSIAEPDLRNPTAVPKVSVRCITADQVDSLGFLVPQKTLASHESCKITAFQADKNSDTLEWKAECAGDTTYHVIERNSGSDFEIDVKVMLAKNEIAGNFKGTALGRACKPGERPL